MKYVYFHIDLNKNDLDHQINTRGEIKDFKFSIYHEMLKISIESIQNCDNEAELIILTDFYTRFDYLDSVKIFRNEIDSSQLMFSRMKAQYQFVKNNPGERIIFIDSDMYLRKNIFKEVYEDSRCGIILTYRNNKKSLVNGGLICVDTTYASAEIFYDKICNGYDQLGRDEKMWWGDQLVVHNHVSDRLNSSLHPKSKLNYYASELDILFIPDFYYNYSPPRYYVFLLMMNSKKLIHFKGERKDMMIEYNLFNNLLKSENKIKSIYLILITILYWVRKDVKKVGLKIFLMIIRSIKF